jgi:hypothetical protein
MAVGIVVTRAEFRPLLTVASAKAVLVAAVEEAVAVQVVPMVTVGAAEALVAVLTEIVAERVASVPVPMAIAEE